MSDNVTFEHAGTENYLLIEVQEGADRGAGRYIIIIRQGTTTIGAIIIHQSWSKLKRSAKV
jgi:hypothetical protein